RSVAGRPGQDDGGPDHPGPADRLQRPGTGVAPGVPARLPADQRHRVRAQRRRGDDERPRPPGPGSRRPGGPARPGGRGAAGRPGAVEVELPTGLMARMYCRPTRSVMAGARVAAVGGVVHVKLIESSRRPAPDSAHSALMLLPGIVGSGALWLRGCQQVQEVYESEKWLVLEGEPGVGKLALIRAVHQRRDPAGHFAVFDAAEATAQDWPGRSRPPPPQSR